MAKTKKNNIDTDIRKAVADEQPIAISSGQTVWAYIKSEKGCTYSTLAVRKYSLACGRKRT
jgi:hypothetical protein